MRKESDNSTFNCIICKEDREYYSKGSCEHNKVCNYCTMKSRMLYKDLRCPICTSKLNHIFILEKSDNISYNDLISQKDDYYIDDDFDSIGIYYTTISAQEEALKLKSYICPIKSCEEKCFDNMDSLNKHLKERHKRFYCDVCLKEGKKFLSEMPLYNNLTLNDHILYGEFSQRGTLLTPPHPYCPVN
jgi:hypothetical protein